VIPHVAGWTFAILPLAMSASIIGVVVGEFVGGAQGLGYIIAVALGQLEATDLFGAMITLCLVAVGLIALAARLDAGCSTGDRSTSAAGSLADATAFRELKR
jgi:NitT/TauT family transport system permease protein